MFARDSLEALNFPSPDSYNATLSDGSLSPQMEERLSVVFMLMFIGGIFIIVATLLRLDVLIRFSSEPHMGAIFAMITVVIMINQVPILLGIHPESYTGFLATFKYVIDTCKHIPDTNGPTAVISAASLAILYFIKEYVNVKFEHKLPAPIPIDIIIMVVATICSHIWNWEERYDVAITGTIPSGIPTPAFPLTSNWTDYVQQGLMFGFLSYLGTSVMFRHFATKHNYKINLNQEFYALGTSFILGSCFSNIGPGISASRVFMMESCGGRTQMTYVVAALTSLAVIVTLADYGNSLPKCIIAAILFVTFSKLSSFKRILKYWRQDKLFLLIWMFTFVLCVVTSVSEGIVYGFGLSIFISAVRTVFPTIWQINEIYADGQRYWVKAKNYTQSKETENSIIYAITGPMYFANSEAIKDRILDLISLSKQTVSNSTTVTVDCAVANNNKVSDIKPEAERTVNVVLDFSCVPYVDISAFRMLIELKGKLNSRYGMSMCLAGCTESVRRCLSNAPNVVIKLEDRIYATIDDALKATNLGHTTERKLNDELTKTDDDDLTDDVITVF